MPIMAGFVYVPLVISLPESSILIRNLLISIWSKITVLKTYHVYLLYSNRKHYYALVLWSVISLNFNSLYFFSAEVKTEKVTPDVTLIFTIVRLLFLHQIYLSQLTNISEVFSVTPALTFCPQNHPYTHLVCCASPLSLWHPISSHHF